MLNFKKLFLIVCCAVVWLSLAPGVSAFTFVAWGDTKSDTTVLRNLSLGVKAMNPTFTIYSGDLVSDGFAQPAMDTWKSAMNGGINNGLFDITFPVRGNHDNQISGSPTAWAGYFDIAQAATRVGAVNYNELNTDLTYSFDYGNSRFLGIDVVGDASLLSSAQISWIDGRLTDAESRGLTHAFIYFHGPLYCVAEHCSCSSTTGCVSSAAVNLVNVINRHPIVTATFHGHEHVLSYTRLTSARIPQLTRDVHEFVSGDAGAGPNTVNANRTDYVMTTGDNKGGFILVDVNGATVTANFYHGGGTSSVHTVTMTKSGSTPGATSTPTPTRTPTPTQTPPTPTPTASAGKPGDANGDGRVDGVDYVIWLNHYNQNVSGAALGDFNNSGRVDGVDYVIWLNNYGR